MAFGIRHFALLLLIATAFAQKPSDRPAPLNPVQGEREARALLAEILAQTPDQDATNNGVLTIRDAEGNQREFPIHFELYTSGANILSVYEATAPGSRAPGTRLTINHANGRPNQYQLLEGPAADATNARPATLSGKETMVPFAGSDFWLADLGLEFLHWPKQCILRKAMSHGQSCGVLESINPDPAPGGYARVLSWIDLDPPHGVVHAEAFDAARKRVKQFDPKTVKKIEGQYKLEAMEMLNERTKSRTTIKFDLKPE